ncbi:hypothetical protein IFR09_03440 [Pseudomonas syringae]|nr:hypothetical protein [Pseudomonas syringae]MBD8573954.1 hypothetical protein [Pseudomonas syringae]MBD8791357.1 hypothetical protein [Pseudomonas syringae]MBD8801509.1 hypothetical protein [Pseudomonas syringae]MBD8810214.1 hypothetical protein [Pseudomonas syringae]
MSLDSVQKNIPITPRRAGIFEEMQREDFLALAAALRRFNACQLPAPSLERGRRIVNEPRLMLALE